jgi:hypothetical protein
VLPRYSISRRIRPPPPPRLRQLEKEAKAAKDEVARLKADVERREHELEQLRQHAQAEIEKREAEKEQIDKEKEAQIKRQQQQLQVREYARNGVGGNGETTELTSTHSILQELEVARNREQIATLKEQATASKLLDEQVRPLTLNYSSSPVETPFRNSGQPVVISCFHPM